MPEILYVDLTTREWTRERLSERYSGLGGRGLTAAIVGDEVPPPADPLGAENVLVLAPGLLAGTAFPNSGRLSVGGKSPLTGGIKEANVGGAAAHKIARLGLAAVVLRGTAAEPVVLEIDNAGVRILGGAELWGLGSYETVRSLTAQHPGCGVIAVGPAGEKGLTAAAVCVATLDGHIRTASRGGLGAVLGKKGVKAIVVDDAGGPGAKVADAEAFKAAAREAAKGLAAHPFSQGLRALGTSMLVGMINELGGMPTRNYSVGRFEGADAIGSDRMTALMAERPNAAASHACMPGCVIHCSQIFTDAEGNYVTSGLEYETLVLTGSNCAIDDLDVIAQIDRLCDDVGLDTIETGAALAVAMEGGKIPWGDGAAVLRVLDGIRRDEPLGLLVGNGCVAVGKALGVTRVPAVKGQSMPAYDPRVFKGTGVTYATSAMGADHTAGIVLPDPAKPDFDITAPEGQAEVSAGVQVMFAALDTLGLCLFTGEAFLGDPELNRHLVAAIAAKFGEELAPDYLPALGTRVCGMERGFNRRAGFGPADDRLPEYFLREPLAPHGLVFDVPAADLDRVVSGG